MKVINILSLHIFCKIVCCCVLSSIIKNIPSNERYWVVRSIMFLIIRLFGLYIWSILVSSDIMPIFVTVHFESLLEFELHGIFSLLIVLRIFCKVAETFFFVFSSLICFDFLAFTFSSLEVVLYRCGFFNDHFERCMDENRQE